MPTRNRNIRNWANVQAYFLLKPTTKLAARRSKNRRAMFGVNKKVGKQKLPIVPRRRLGKQAETSFFRHAI